MVTKEHYEKALAYVKRYDLYVLEDYEPINPMDKNEGHYHNFKLIINKFIEENKVVIKCERCGKKHIYAYIGGPKRRFCPDCVKEWNPQPTGFRGIIPRGGPSHSKRSYWR